MSREDRIREAAVAVVARDGMRGLTHRAVDRQAGLTMGSTSNVFRTRTALIDGVLSQLIRREQAVLDALPQDDLRSELSASDLVTLAAKMIVDALGPGREYTLARHALFAEAAQRPQIAAQLEAASQHWWGLTAGLLARLNVPDAGRRGRWLLAYVDGIISDQLARPEPHFDAKAAIAPAMFGISSVAPMDY